MASTIKSDNTKPDILVIALSHFDFLNDAHTSLLNRLSELCNVKRVGNVTEALKAFSDTTFRAILITDEGLSDPENQIVLTRVKMYVEKGGLAIVNIPFTSFISLDLNQFNAFFRAFDLPWKRGKQHHCEVRFVPSSAIPGGLNPAELPRLYRMKAVHINFARIHEKIYIPIPESMIGMMDVSLPKKHVELVEAAVTAARIGRGDLVYCGDVNGEDGSVSLIMALCGF